MVNWTDHGSPMSLATFSWASANAWAGQAIYRNGKFYWYVPVTDRPPAGWRIGVAVSDSPTGPFTRRARPPAGRERRDRPHRLHRRRRAGVPVLGQPESVVREAERRHDLVLRQPDADPAHHRGIRHPHRQRQPARRCTRKAPGSTSATACTTSCSRRNAARSSSATPRRPDPTGPWTYRGTIMPTQGSSFTNHPGVDRLQRRLVLLLPQRRAAGRRRLHPLGRGGEVQLQRRRHHPDDQHDHDRCAAGRHAESVCAPRGRDHRLGVAASRPSRPAKAG